MSKNIIITLLAIVATMLCVVLTLVSIHLYASQKLLHELRVVKPGVDINAVIEQLGRPRYEISDSIPGHWNWGPIKDPSFMQDKKKFWFRSGSPPCRDVVVYTDTNNIVLFVTWKGM